MELELTKADELLNEDGTLKYAGYAKSPLLKFNKENAKPKWRLREWDKYFISDGRLALSLCICNMRYAAVVMATVIDFANDLSYSKTSSVFFPKDKDFMSLSPVEGKSSFKTKKADFDFEVKDNKRVLKGYFNDFYPQNGEDTTLQFEIRIDDPAEGIFKVTPFAKKKQFYLSHRITGADCEGTFSYKGKTYSLVKGFAHATFDFGRGVLPYKTIRYWASIQDEVGGKSFTLNIGHGTGDHSAASENIVFYDGKASKLEAAKIYIRRNRHFNDYLGNWTFYSQDGKLELMFEPFLDFHKSVNYLVASYMPHQVFGAFTGRVTLDDGTTIELNRVFGFAERVVCRW